MTDLVFLLGAHAAVLYLLAFAVLAFALLCNVPSLWRVVRRKSPSTRKSTKRNR